MKNIKYLGMIMILSSIVICFCTTTIFNYKLKIKEMELQNKTALELQKNIMYFQIETLKMTNELLTTE